MPDKPMTLADLFAEDPAPHPPKCYYCGAPTPTGAHACNPLCARGITATAENARIAEDAEKQEADACKECDGTGEIDCPACDGGETADEGGDCGECGGSGRVDCPECA